MLFDNLCRVRWRGHFFEQVPQGGDAGDHILVKLHVHSMALRGQFHDLLFPLGQPVDWDWGELRSHEKSAGAPRRSLG